MIIQREVDFDDLVEELWGCDDVLNAIENAGLQAEFMQYLEDNFNNEAPDIQALNDFIRFDDGATLKYFREEYPEKFESETSEDDE